MRGLDPGVLHNEVRALGDDIRRLLPELRKQMDGHLPREASDLVFLGSGDSRCVAMSAVSACAMLRGPPSNALTPFEYEEYGNLGGPDSLIVAISASGETPDVVAALSDGSARGARSVAVTTNPESALCELADWSLVAELPRKEVSPGVRSYQATLLAAFMVVLRIAQPRQRDGFPGLGGVAAAVDRTVDGLERSVESVTSRIHDAVTWTLLGSGPNQGTARYAAAKVMESLGQVAVGSPLEEWWHCERNVLPVGHPLFVIAPPGPSLERAARVVEKASDQGRDVFVVADSRETTFRARATALLPISATEHEHLSPFVCHIFAPVLTALVAESRSSRLFPIRDLRLPGAARP